MRRSMQALCDSVIVGVVVAFLLSPSKASADIAPPQQPPGSNPSPGAESTHVAMVKETVRIVLQPGPWPGSLREDLVRDWAKVTASFLMKDEGSAPEQMQVRFPLSNPAGWGDGFGNYRELTDLAVQVNGATAPTQHVTTPNPQSQSEPPVAWAAFEVTFPAGVEVPITVTYSLLATGYHPFSMFTYILETGAGWKGTIGEADLDLALPYSATNEDLRLDLSSPATVCWTPATCTGPTGTLNRPRGTTCG